MKALEILKSVRNGVKVYFTHVQAQNKYYDEAIAELEALQSTVTMLEERLLEFISIQAQDSSNAIQMLKRITELEALQDEVKDAEWRLDLCLAQQRALQEPKTCYGCKYRFVSTMYAQKCRDCARYEDRSYVVDNYEPKEP